jgi:hypothetical protein
MYKKHLNTWIAALVAGFLVLVLPACWYGALARAQALNVQGPSSSNNNEEREEHERGEETQRQALGTRPPPPARSSARIEAARFVVAQPAPAILVASIAPVPHPAQFSIRRLR